MGGMALNNELKRENMGRLCYYWGCNKSEVYSEVKDVELCRIWKRKQI